MAIDGSAIETIPTSVKVEGGYRLVITRKGEGRLSSQHILQIGPSPGSGGKKDVLASVILGPEVGGLGEFPQPLPRPYGGS